MRHVIAILAGVVLLPVLAVAQAPERTPWGDPDLQGVWTNRTTTPLERPSEFEGRTELSAEERAELDAQNGVRLAGGAPGVATTGNGSPVQGVAFDAGRLVTSGVEVGIGLDLTTHPGQALLSNVQGVGLRTATREDSALQVLTGERAVQLDLAARLTYRSRGDDRMVRGVSLARPYVGIGAGMSRYFPGFSTIGGLGFDDAPLPRSGAAHLAAFDPWIPNFQIYGGFLVSFARRAPMLDIDIRYVRAANRGVDLGGFRIGTGVRYRF